MKAEYSGIYTWHDLPITINIDKEFAMEMIVKLGNYAKAAIARNEFANSLDALTSMQELNEAIRSLEEKEAEENAEESEEGSD